MTTITLLPHIKVLQTNGFVIANNYIPRARGTYRQVRHSTIDSLTCAETTRGNIGFYSYGEMISSIDPDKLDGAWLERVLTKASYLQAKQIAEDNVRLAKEREQDSAWLASRSAMAQILRNTHGCTVDWKAKEDGRFKISCIDHLPGRIINRSSPDSMFSVTAVHNLNDNTIDGFEIGSIRIATTCESAEAKAAALIDVLTAISNNP